ncbi:MAG: N-6 DNA methylase, partial [Acidaminococcaceae bacterium]
LRANKVPDEKIAAMLTGYEFIRVNKAVKEHLLPTIAKIYRHLFYALRPNSSLDLLGNFYGEFLRYSGGDQQGLGIVLTPRHVTELFSDLADLDPRSSIVLDTCTGTGGFLISAMAYMIDKASNDSALIKRIKKEGLVGIELDQHMYTLACANMIFRGDGKANMFWDDCLTPKEPNTELKIAKIRPNVAMLNPPYSKKAKGKHELAFVKKALDMLQVGGVGIAIIPVGALIDDRTECATIKKELLSAHTLTAVMSMPPQLFPGVGTVTAIAVFEAHKPHCRTISKKIEARDEKGEIIVKNGRPLFVDSQVEVPRIETWFGYWRDDGFMLNKGKRVERSLGAWNEIKQEWLSMFRRRSEIKGKSCLQEVTYRDEWLAEAYMETDYSLLTQEHFEKEVRK